MRSRFGWDIIIGVLVGLGAFLMVVTATGTYALLKPSAGASSLPACARPTVNHSADLWAHKNDVAVGSMQWVPDEDDEVAIGEGKPAIIIHNASSPHPRLEFPGVIGNMQRAADFADAVDYLMGKTACPS